MGSTIIQTGLNLGIFTTWIGLACLFIAVVAPKFAVRRFFENNAIPLSDRLERMNADFVQGSKSRLGRTGQWLIAVGTTLLILTGIFWLALRIF